MCSLQEKQQMLLNYVDRLVNDENECAALRNEVNFIYVQRLETTKEKLEEPIRHYPEQPNSPPVSILYYDNNRNIDAEGTSVNPTPLEPYEEVYEVLRITYEDDKYITSQKTRALVNPAPLEPDEEAYEVLRIIYEDDNCITSEKTGAIFVWVNSPYGSTDPSTMEQQEDRF